MTEEKQKVSRKEVLPYVEKIEQITTHLIEVVSTMPECSIKKAYENSIKNLEKKNEQYGKPVERFSVSDEEKELLKNFRAGKVALVEKEEYTVSSNDGDMGKEKKGEHGRGKDKKKN